MAALLLVAELVELGLSSSHLRQPHVALHHDPQVRRTVGSKESCQPTFVQLCVLTLDLGGNSQAFIFNSDFSFFFKLFSGIPLIFVMKHTCFFHLGKKRLLLEVHGSSPFLAAGNKLINAGTIQGTILILY